METVSTYSEARNEYLKQLYTWITPYMIQFYRTIWTDSLRTGGNQRVMVVFQERCAEVPKWNQDTIDGHVGKLLDSCRCDYLEELMSAVFIAHTKVLIAVRISSRQKKLQITLPKLDHFLHRIFSECARSFWKAPYLFLEDAKPIEMQKNLLQAEALCNDAIGSAVRSLLPIKNILNEYLSEDLAEEVEAAPAGGAVSAPVAAPAPVSAAPEAPTLEAAAPESATSVSAAPVPATSETATSETATLETATLETAVPVSATPVSSTPVSAAPVSATPVSAAPVSATPVSATPVSATPVSATPVSAAAPEEIVIDAEPAVHFSNYDNEFEDGRGGTFKYVPKYTDDTPHLEIKEGSEIPLSEDTSVMSLDAPGNDKLEIDEILD